MLKSRSDQTWPLCRPYKSLWGLGYHHGLLFGCQVRISSFSIWFVINTRILGRTPEGRTPPKTEAESGHALRSLVGHLYPDPWADLESRSGSYQLPKRSIGYQIGGSTF